MESRWRRRSIAITRDRVPRSKCNFLYSGTNFAQGRANLYLPFRVPAGGNYFVNFVKDKVDRREKKEARRKKRASTRRATKSGIALRATAGIVFPLLHLFGINCSSRSLAK